MNQMCFRAKGEYFCQLSAGDTLEPTYLEKVMAEFERNPWLEFVASQTDFYEADMKTPLAKGHTFWGIPKVVNRSREEWLEALYSGNHYFGVGTYRVCAVSEVGGWEKQYKVIVEELKGVGEKKADHWIELIEKSLAEGAERHARHRVRGQDRGERRAEGRGGRGEDR